MQGNGEVSPLFTLTVIVFLILAYKFIRSFIKFCKTDTSKYEPPKPSRKRQPQSSTPYYSFTSGYQRARFLTNNEYGAYFALKEIADTKNLVVCPKVRLLDIVEPQYGIKKRYSLLRKVMSKHVDFVICTADMQVYAIVELDDASHLRPDRKERDHFVDTVLSSVGYPVIHTYGITNDIFDHLPPV